ncbi:hypothetical protein HD806DRAFT_537713 [Xylariaceae sp. AK1471]|nr:hypothetical protein HD806DRAFT_537713 [Xylariaceae sp. AK1471]
MSSTAAATIPITSSSASVPSPTAVCNPYQIPITDAACAVPFGSGSNHTDAMSHCCKSAEVVSYFNDCGLYCVAVDQTIGDLQKCLFGQGVMYQDVFCNAGVNATATNTRPDLPPASASASASVVANGNGNDGGESGSESGASPTPSKSGNAAAGLAPEMGFSTMGFMIGGLLFSAMAFGAFQI